MLAGPVAEGKYMPVTTDVKVTLLKQENGAMYFEATGNKVRNCALLGARILVDTNSSDEKPPVKGSIRVVDDGIGDKVRALGEQNLGIWEIKPIGDSVYVQASYKCHNFWITNLQLGEWHRDKP